MSTNCILRANSLQSNRDWCVIKSIDTHNWNLYGARGNKNHLWLTRLVPPQPVLTQPHTDSSLNDVTDGPGKHPHRRSALVCGGDRRHFWSTDLDLNEMKVADLRWERTRGDVESRLLLVRLLCLLAVGPQCWHISSVSDSTKLKMLGLSTDPISPRQGPRGFQRFRWRALSFSA